jgi:hypothetical protein
MNKPMSTDERMRLILGLYLIGAALGKSNCAPVGKIEMKGHEKWQHQNAHNATEEELREGGKPLPQEEYKSQFM